MSGVSLADAPLVGGKNASLGELIRNLAQAGVRVPDGFATTAAAFRQFTAQNNFADSIRESTLFPVIHLALAREIWGKCFFGV